MLAGPDPIVLTRALAAIGLPAPIRARPLGPPLLSASWELEFPEGARMARGILRVRRADPGWGGAGAERAALRAAHLFTDLPVARELAVLDPGSDRPEMSLCSALPGLKGTELLRRGGEAARRAAREVGRVMATLESAPQAGFATRATPSGEWLPRRATWREELGALLEAAVLRAELGGTTLGPLSERLHALARADLPALDGVSAHALVHGDLHPGNLLFVEEEGWLALSGVIDWEWALAGDPAMDWAVALAMPAPMLAAVVEGYGRDRAAELLDPDVEARLGVYLRYRGLLRLAVAALPVLGENQGRARALLLEMSVPICEEAAGEGVVRRKIEAALAGSREPVLPRALPAGPDLLRRRALEALRYSERMGTAEAMGLAATLASASNARIAEVAEPHLLLGEGLLPRLGSTLTGLPAGPLDRTLWRETQVEQTLSELGRTREPGPCLSLALLALVLDALDGVGGSASAEVLRGAEALLAGVLAREKLARAGELPSEQRLIHGWIGLWALGRLAPQGRPELAACLAAQVVHAWQALALPASQEQDLAALLALAPAAVRGGADPLTLIALHAWGQGVVPAGLAPAAALRALWGQAAG